VPPSKAELASFRTSLSKKTARQPVGVGQLSWAKLADQRARLPAYALSTMIAKRMHATKLNHLRKIAALVHWKKH
jgi:hypothetical protein